MSSCVYVARNKFVLPSSVLSIVKRSPSLQLVYCKSQVEFMNHRERLFKGKTALYLKLKGRDVLSCQSRGLSNPQVTKVNRRLVSSCYRRTPGDRTSLRRIVKRVNVEELLR